MRNPFDMEYETPPTFRRFLRNGAEHIAGALVFGFMWWLITAAVLGALELQLWFLWALIPSVAVWIFFLITFYNNKPYWQTR